MEPAPEKRRRRSHRKTKGPSFLRRFRFEITALILFLLGLFLLFERMEIKEWLFRVIVGGFKGITTGIVELTDWLKEWILAFEFSDILGVIFIVAAIIMILVRARVQLVAHYAELEECPECEGEMVHVHRLPQQRWLGSFLRIKIRRYRCKECGTHALKMSPASTRSRGSR